MEDMGVKSQVIHIFGKISNFAVILCGAWKIILRSGRTGRANASLGFNSEFSTSQDDFAKTKLTLSLGGGACLSLVF